MNQLLLCMGLLLGFTSAEAFRGSGPELYENRPNNFEKGQSDRRSTLTDDGKNSTKVINVISKMNLGLATSLIVYYAYTGSWRGKNLFQTAIVEIGCNVASAYVDTAPSKKNSIVGWSNVVWGGIKLAGLVTGNVAIGTQSNYIIPYLYFGTTLIANSINAVYRLCYPKGSDSMKK